MADVAGKRLASFDLEYGKDRVWVWHVDLSDALSFYGEYQRQVAEVLSEAEQARAQGFVTDIDRAQYSLSHVALHRLLAEFLDVDLNGVPFHHNRHGKPFLADQQAPGRIYFNLSHSGNHAVIAVGYDRVLGVDVEQLRAIDDLDSLVDRFLSPYESSALRALPPSDRRAAFFRVWTRKEAFVKAEGSGLSFPLHAFDVSVLPDQEAAILRISHDDHDRKHWSLLDLDTPSTCVGAVVAQGSKLEVEQHTIDVGRLIACL